FFFQEKTGYGVATVTEFRRVLFRSAYILDQIQNVSVVGVYGAYKGRDAGPYQQPRGGQAPQAGRQNESIVVRAYADRMLEAVVRSEERRVGKSVDVGGGGSMIKKSV